MDAETDNQREEDNNDNHASHESGDAHDNGSHPLDECFEDIGNPIVADALAHDADDGRPTVAPGALPQVADDGSPLIEV